MNKTLLLVLISLLPVLGFSQVQINGSVDAAIKAGGKESGFFVNGIPEDFTHLHATAEEFNLLLFAPLSENFYTEARVKISTFLTGKLGVPKLELANVTYSPADKNYFLSAGKIILPFGFYPNRQLQIDRTFIDYPMSYSYSLFISRERGWWKGTRGKYYTDETASEDRDYGINTLFYGGYTTGLVYGVENQKSSFRLALTNESPTGYDASNINTLAGMMRWTHSPNAYLTFGLSASHGSFMHQSAVHDSVDYDFDLSKFTQTALGFDIQLGFTYFEIVSELTYSKWKVPGYTNEDGFIEQTNRELEEFDLANIAANIDIRYEPPFFTGGYFALRADQLYFPTANSATQGGDFMWDYDITRLTALVGYKLDRNVLLKIAVAEQDNFNGDFYSFKAYVTAAF